MIVSSPTFMYRFIGSGTIAGSSFIMPKFTFVKSLAKSETDSDNLAAYEANIDKNGIWTIEFLESGFLRFYYLTEPLEVSIFCCGGGGGGATAFLDGATQGNSYGGGGGGGGYISNTEGVLIDEDHIYLVFVGPGGAGAPYRYLKKSPETGKYVRYDKENKAGNSYERKQNNFQDNFAGGFVGERGERGKATFWFAADKNVPNNLLNNINGLFYRYEAEWPQNQTKNGICMYDKIKSQEAIDLVDENNYKGQCIEVITYNQSTSSNQVQTEIKKFDIFEDIINSTNETIKQQYPIVPLGVAGSETITSVSFIGAEGGFGGDFVYRKQDSNAFSGGLGGNGGSGGGGAGMFKQDGFIDTAFLGGDGGSNGSDGGKGGYNTKKVSTNTDVSSMSTNQRGIGSIKSPKLQTGNFKPQEEETMRAFQATYGVIYGSGGAGSSCVSQYKKEGNAYVLREQTAKGGSGGSKAGGGDGGAVPILIMWEKPPVRKMEVPNKPTKQVLEYYHKGINTFSKEGPGLDGMKNTGAGGGGGGFFGYPEKTNGAYPSCPKQFINIEDKGNTLNTKLTVWTNTVQNDSTTATLPDEDHPIKSWYPTAFGAGNGGSGITIMRGRSTKKIDPAVPSEEEEEENPTSPAANEGENNNNNNNEEGSEP